MNNLSCKRDFPGLERPRLDELIEERSLVAFGIAKARNESGNLGVLNRNLNELSVAQEGVHAGIIIFGFGLATADCRRKNRQPKEKDFETPHSTREYTMAANGMFGGFHWQEMCFFLDKSFGTA